MRPHPPWINSESGSALVAGVAESEHRNEDEAEEVDRAQREPGHVDDRGRHSGDVVLAVACLAKETWAIQLFEDTTIAAAEKAIRKYSTDAAFLEDIMQMLRVQLLVGSEEKPPTLSIYNAKGSLGAWVSVCAIRLTLYQLRTSRNRKEDNYEWADVLTEAGTGSPELDAIKHRFRDSFSAAVKQTCSSLPSRQRAVLRMHFVEDLSVASIATAYAVNRTTVWRWIEQARDELQKGILEHLQASDPLSRGELPEIARMIQSQLDLGLSQLLVTKAHVGGKD